MSRQPATNPTSVRDWKAEIDAMTLVEMLGRWRFAPAGTFQRGDPCADYFIKVMNERRAADNMGWVAASKQVGWDR